MPENTCLVQELGLADAIKTFEKAAGAAESPDWAHLGLGVLAAYGGALVTLPAFGTGSIPGLLLFWNTVLKDVQEKPEAEAAAQQVADAFDALQRCREDHKVDDEDPFGDPPPPSVFHDFPVIPFQDPDPDSDVSDDEILIFDEDDFIVIEDDDENIVITDPE
jgi:hypothetical protein